MINGVCSVHIACSRFQTEQERRTLFFFIYILFLYSYLTEPGIKIYFGEYFPSETTTLFKRILLWVENFVMTGINFILYSPWKLIAVAASVLFLVLLTGIYFDWFLHTRFENVAKKRTSRAILQRLCSKSVTVFHS